MKPEEIANRVIRATFDPSAGVFWTGGKDSTLLLYLIRQVYNSVPNPVIFLDSTDEFQEIYEFINRLEDEWQLKINRFIYDASTPKMAREDKIRAIEESIDRLGLDKVYVAIRRDESEAREDARYLEPKEDHVRIHPILDFTEKYLWEYTWKNDIPYCPLYDEGYRSLGEKSYTNKSDKTERSGRDAIKEKQMKRLRELGYF